MIAGSQGQKTSQVSCRASSVSSCEAARDQITVRQTLSSPLLNFSPADLIAAYFEEGTHEEANAAQQASVASAPVRRQSERVIFTEEKARRLRRANRATQTFHDKWYHSAITSRLATPE